MKCPFCSNLESKVIDSRPANEGISIRRRRECLQCHHRFTTYETIEVTPLIVVKKDGSRQVFDRAKLLGSMLKACEKRSISLQMLERAADEIAKMSARMRKRQFGSVDDLSPEVNEVDINRPRAVSHHPHPSEIVLDRMHSARKVKRIKVCLKYRDLIEKLERGEFLWHINWFGLNDGTRLHKPRPGQGRKRDNRPPQIVRPWLNIRSKGDNRPITWPLGVRP